MTSFKHAQFLRRVILSTVFAVGTFCSFPAVAAVKSVHWQYLLTLSCSGTSCSGLFPIATAKKRFNISRISCRLNGPPGSAMKSADLLVGDLKLKAAAFLSHVHTSSDGVHELNDAVDLRIGAGQHIQALLSLESGIADSAFCLETGTVELVQ